MGRAHRVTSELGRELACLHGKLMATELRSIGINYPLATVSDLAHNLFATRGLDTDAARVGELMGQIVEGALSVEHMMFVTKHFPGLGLTSGDTHDLIVVAPSYDDATKERVLRPFRGAIDGAAGIDAAERLSVLAGHAKFPSFDAELPTTVSPTILGPLLRDELGFSGVVVSDAMWMGPYGTMPTSQVVRVYVQSFLAGMDLLLIPGAKYESAVGYFRRLAADQLAVEEEDALAAQLGLPFDEVRARFVERVHASRARLDAAREQVGYAHEHMATGTAPPRGLTIAERTRYNEILHQLDARFPE
jgi:beta-glucosidase-like glycosyl hydrolase